MPKTKISEFSATPANNTDIDSINIAEGCAPSGINDAIRELMAQLKDFQTGAVGDSFNGPVGTSTAAAGAFTTLSASGTATLSGLTASTALALDASKNVVSVTNTGTGNNVLATSPTLVTPILGTPTSATLTNATGLPIATGVSGLGTGVATFLATPSSANLAAALTDETGTGSAVFATSPTLVTPVLGTPTSATLTNATGLPLTTGVTGTLPTANGGTNLGGATPFTSGGVVYASSSSALATGSALVFDGAKLSLPTTLAIKGAQNGNIAKIAMTRTDASYSINNETDLRFYGQTTDTESPANILYSMNTGGTFVWNNGSGTEQMRLTSTGLGIGTSSPADKLEVYSTITARASSGTSALRLRNTTTDMQWQSVAGTNAVSLYDSGAGATRLTVDSSGNLGLGVTPSAWNTSYKALEISALGNSLIGFGASDVAMSSGAYYDSAGWKYSATNSLGASFYEQYNGQHLWYTKTAVSHSVGDAITFTQAMTLDASGRLMVGQTSTYDSSTFNVTSATGQNIVAAFDGGGSSARSRFFITMPALNTTMLNVDQGTGVLAFGQNGVEKARIDSSGNLLVGTTSALNGITLVNTNGVSSYRTTATGGLGLHHFYSNVGGTATLKSYVDTSGAYTTISDMNFKTDILPARSYVNDLMNIEVVTFKWKDDENINNKNIGVIAQQVQTIFPSLVKDIDVGNGKTQKMLPMDAFIPMILKTIQEQQAIIESLKARLDAANL